MFATELLKLRTTRTPWILAAVALAGLVLTLFTRILLPLVLGSLSSLQGAGFMIGVQAAPDVQEELLHGLAAQTDLGSVEAQRGMLDLLGNGAGGSAFGVTALCMLLLGVLAVTTDYRTGGIVTTALVVPGRLRILLGKAGATAAVALGVGVVLAIVTAIGLAAAIATAPGARLMLDPGEALGIWGRGLLVLVLLSWLGLAVGTLVRGQVAAIVVVALLALFEPLVQGLGMLLSSGNAAITAWLPLSLSAVASTGQGGAELFGGTTSLGPLTALGGLAVWAVALIVVAAVVFRRRDLA